MTKFTQLIAPFALATGLLPIAALAAPERPTRSIVLDTDGIDLSTPVGIAVLDARIDAAVRSVCGPQMAGNGIVNAAVRACREKAHDSLAARKLAAIAAQRRATALAGR